MRLPEALSNPKPTLSSATAACIKLFAILMIMLFDSPLLAAQLTEDLLVVPGKSLGKVSLGMAVAKVENALGKPDKEQPGNWVEYARPGDKVDIFFIDGAASEIRFNSKKYKTVDGLSLSNWNDKRWRDRFDYARMQTKFMNARMCLKSGGFAIYRLNIDGSTDYPLQTMALIYGTEHPVHQPRMYMGEADGGWEEWDGKAASLFDAFKSPQAQSQHGLISPGDY